MVEMKETYIKFNNKSKVRKFKRLLNSYANNKCLDVGCGTGFLTQSFTIGLDANKEYIRTAKKRMGCVVGNAEQLPFKNESFDLILSTYLIHHLSHSEKFIEEARRCSKDLFLTIDVNPFHPYTLLFQFLHGERIYWIKDYLTTKKEFNNIRIRFKPFIPGSVIIEARK